MYMWNLKKISDRRYLFCRAGLASLLATPPAPEWDSRKSRQAVVSVRASIPTRFSVFTEAAVTHRLQIDSPRPKFRRLREPNPGQSLLPERLETSRTAVRLRCVRVEEDIPHGLRAVFLDLCPFLGSVRCFPFAAHNLEDLQCLLWLVLVAADVIVLFPLVVFGDDSHHDVDMAFVEGGQSGSHFLGGWFTVCLSVRVGESAEAWVKKLES